LKIELGDSFPEASLFPDTGIIKICECPSKELILPNLLNTYGQNLSQIDLSSFKAKLVKNKGPFQIPNTGDESFEFITYYYGPNYVDKYILK
jgi:hypothetical protein